MLILYTFVVFASGVAAEQALHGEHPLAMMGVTLISVLAAVFAARRLSDIVKREGRWQISLGPFRLTHSKSRAACAAGLPAVREQRRRRGRSCVSLTALFPRRPVVRRIVVSRATRGRRARATADTGQQTDQPAVLSLATLSPAEREWFHVYKWEHPASPATMQHMMAQTFGARTRGKVGRLLRADGYPCAAW